MHVSVFCSRSCLWLGIVDTVVVARYVVDVAAATAAIIARSNKKK